jgi:hypothetical protein
VVLALAFESIVAVVAAMHVTNVEFRLAALGAFVALALVGPQRWVLDLTSPKLALWSHLRDPPGSASKAA